MPILSLITYAPLVGVAAILALRLFGKPDDAKSIETSKWIALIATLATLALSILLVAQFNPADNGFQFVEETPWFAGFSYRMGVDGISVLFVLLTAFLMPICIAASWKAIEKRVHEYMIAFLLLETLVVGVFCALDIVLFYLFFEFGLVPMFLIIGIWGGQRRVYAAFKFFLYTLLGSVLMLAAILAMIGISHTSSIPELMVYHFAPGVQTWLWLAFFASFAVKMPMWPVHTWLPDAHVEAPTAGSVILAGILLKMGGYGFMRFSLPMFPQASQMFTPLVFALSVIAIVYTSLVAFRQTDMKKLIAYSSVAHMGFVTMGIFSGNAVGEQGALFQMLSHGVISGALFLGVGVVYDRMHTREIAFYGGLVSRMPWYAATFMLFTMGNVGLPGTSGFVGEIMTMTGTYGVSTWTAFVAATGVILSAVYALNLYRAVIFGTITNPKLAAITDLDWREVAIFAPLIASTLFLGVYPSSVFNLTQASVDHLVSAYQAAIGGWGRMIFSTELGLAWPELILASGALLLLVVGAFSPKNAAAVGWAAVLALLAAAVAAATGPMGRGFTGGLISDDASVFAKVAIYVASAFAIPLGQRWFERRGVHNFEFPILILLAALGMGMMASAGDLISLYVGVELHSLALYVLAAMHRDNAKASEAGLKYFVLGALSSGMLLYGASLVYGFAGSTVFTDIALAVQGGAHTGVLFGLVFLICGLAFKVSAAPFHMWTPDVYEGAPTPVVAFFAAAPKLAAMVLFARVLAEAFGGASGQWQQVLVALGLISIAVGAFAGLAQTNLKRLWAYSSIANVGYAILGLAAANAEGVQSMLVFMVLYMVDVTGFFACLAALSRQGKAMESIEDMAGLFKEQPGIALAMTAFSLSALGLPPFSGFWAKLFVFKALLGAGFGLAAVAGLVGSVVAAFYYLRLIKVMWFDAAVGATDKPPVEAKGIGLTLALFSFPVVLGALVWIYPAAGRAAHAFGLA